MSTLQDNGTKIRLSSNLNIEKMKKSLPRTPKIVEYLKSLIIDLEQAQTKPKTKTEKSLAISN